MKKPMIVMLIVTMFPASVNASEVCISSMLAVKNILQEASAFTATAMSEPSRDILVTSAKYIKLTINSYEQVLNNCKLSKTEVEQIKNWIDGEEDSLEKANKLIWSGLYK